MGSFKIEQPAQEQPKYCDYIQEKIDIAQENGAVYELADEDRRIQALYDQENVTNKDVIKVINRVRSNDDGKEYIVVNKNVDFFTQNGVFKDRYSAREGIVELPLKTTNPETGAVETKQNRIVYTIPFEASKVDEYLEKSEGQGSVPQLAFYDGATTSNRLPNNLPSVSNPDFFKEASWTELQVGREKKVLNSLINRLPEVREELKKNNSSFNKTDSPSSTDKQQQQSKQQGQPIQEVVERQQINPSDPRNQPPSQQKKEEVVQLTTTKQELNKVEQGNENIVEVKSSPTTGSTGGGNTPTAKSGPFSRKSDQKN